MRISPSGLSVLLVLLASGFALIGFLGKFALGQLRDGIQKVGKDLGEDIAAVKTDVTTVKTDLTSQIASVKADLTSQIATVKTDASQTIAAVRAELVDRIADFKAHTSEKFAEIGSDLTQVRNDMNHVGHEHDKLERRVTRAESRQELADVGALIDTPKRRTTDIDE